jgi:hypothetical protein
MPYERLLGFLDIFAVWKKTGLFQHPPAFALRTPIVSDMAMFQQLPTLQEFGGETARRIILRSTKGYGLR